MKPPPFSPRLSARVAALALVAGTAVGAAGCGAATVAAVTVNGHVISQGDLDSELKAIAGNPEYVKAVESSSTPIRGAGGANNFTLAFTDRVLTRQLFLELVHEEAVRRNIKVIDAEVAKARTDEQAQIDAAPRSQSTGQPAGPPSKIWEAFAPSYQALLARRQAEVTDVQNAVGGVNPDPAAVRKFYDTNQGLFSQNCVSHILISVPANSTPAATAAAQDQATKIRAQIAAGGDFAALAKQFSTDPGSKAKGGDLGCVAPGAYVTEFENAIKSLSVGQLSPVVKTSFGFHVIKLTDRKVSPYSQTAVLQAMQTQGQSKFSQFVMDAVAKAKVTVNRRYGTFQAQGQNAGITPPTPPPASAGAPPPPGSNGSTPTTASRLAQTPPTQPDASQTPASTPPTSAP